MSNAVTFTGSTTQNSENSVDVYETGSPSPPNASSWACGIQMAACGGTPWASPTQSEPSDLFWPQCSSSPINWFSCHISLSCPRTTDSRRDTSGFPRASEVSQSSENFPIPCLLHNPILWLIWLICISSLTSSRKMSWLICPLSLLLTPVDFPI